MDTNVRDIVCNIPVTAVGLSKVVAAGDIMFKMN
jgi:hypothetical protein